MQPLHWGFFVRWDGEKPVESPDANPLRADANPPRNPLRVATTRRNAQRGPWNFSPYLDVVYHKAL